MPAPGAESVGSRRPPRFSLKSWIAVGGASLFAVVLLGVAHQVANQRGNAHRGSGRPHAIVQVLNEKNEVQIERKGGEGTR